MTSPWALGGCQKLRRNAAADAQERGALPCGSGIRAPPPGPAQRLAGAAHPTGQLRTFDELRASRLDVPIDNQPCRRTDVNRVTGGAICPTMVS
jgi:hypothetical protein